MGHNGAAEFNKSSTPLQKVQQNYDMIKYGRFKKSFIFNAFLDIRKRYNNIFIELITRRS